MRSPRRIGSGRRLAATTRRPPGCAESPVNRAASVVRRRVREAQAIVRLAYRTPTHIELDEGDAEFWRSVRALPPRQAQAVALFYLEDYSVRDIAAVLDCSEGTVKTHLSRARTAVARRLRLERVEDGHE